jgi:shikimate dehydrogenase
VKHRAAVLGSPVEHSLSPVLHRAAWAAVGFEGTYERILCTEPGLPAVLELVRRDPAWVGLSLTMPLKAVVLELVEEVSQEAARLGTANTVVRRTDGSLWATTTDGAGISHALRELGDPPGPVAVLGAGGTARAALGALQGREVTVVAREPQRAAAVARLVGASVLAWEQLDVAQFAVVISTVVSGALVPGWTAPTPLLDVVYDPWPTPLAAQALAAGAPVVGGLPVLVGQAAEQVRLMTGFVVDPALLRKALALNG